MKKNKFLYASLIAAAAIAAGCTKENIDTASAERGEGTTLTVSAVAKDPGLKGNGTKVSYGSVDATWEEGDKIFLINGDGATITLTLSEGAGTSSGKFVSTDAVVAGSYTPYAVSASSLSAGYVSVSDGTISLNLASAGGGTLADALEHDILKGSAVTLTEGQTTATIGALDTHILSYVKVTFTSESKEIASIGLDSAGGLYGSVAIAADGTITGGDATTEKLSVAASSDGAGNYVGYFAVYDSSSLSLSAHATDADGGEYSRLISTKAEVSYAPGTVYGKTFTLSESMVTAAAEGTLSDQTWRNLGLSVKWATINVNGSGDAGYNYDDYPSSIPVAWSGWRLPTQAEVSELFYASTRTWITGDVSAVRFSCNDNSVVMGAGGRYYWWWNSYYSEGDRVDGEGTILHFWVADEEYSATVITEEGTALSFNKYSYYYNSRNDAERGYKMAIRLVCDY